MSGILAALAGIKTAIATAVDEYFNRVTLLLNTSSTNGAQNNTFLDSSTNNFTITRNGNTTQGTFTPFSQTGWSNYFSGSGNYINVTPTTALQVAAGDFTIEFFIYFDSVSSTQVLMNYGYEGTTQRSFLVYYNSDNTLHFAYSTTGSNNTDVSLGSLSASVGTWYHIAVVRNGTTVTGYKNGTALSSPLNISTNTIYYPSASGAFRLANDGSNQTLGYMSNFRLVKGTAVYTSAFTPPTTPLTAISGTSLLTCQSNRFVDNSASPLTISVTGTPSVQAFSPFLPTAAYDTAVVGGSGYFDGSGDYLVTPSNAAVSSTLLGSDFTIECWLYLTTYPGGGAPIWTNSTSNSDGFSSVYVTSSGTIALGKVGVNEVASTATIVRNAWNHFATVRSGATVYLYLNGVEVASGAASTYLNTSSAKPLQIAQSNQSSPSNLTGYISCYRVASSAIYTGSTYTIPTSVPTAISGTQLLLNFTNAGIYDSASKSSWETVNNVQVSTAQAKWGTTSIYFPGSTSNQRLLPSQNYQFDIFGTGDFTIECWLYVIAQGATTVSGLWDQRPGVNGTYINWVVDFGGYGQGSSSNPKLVLYTNSAVLYASGVLTMGAWNHVALCRASGTTRMFINGTLSGTAVSDTNNYLGGGSAGNYRPSIGSTDGGDSLYGYIDDFRVTRYARYTTNFTAPTAAFGTQ